MGKKNNRSKGEKLNFHKAQVKGKLVKINTNKATLQNSNYKAVQKLPQQTKPTFSGEFNFTRKFLRIMDWKFLVSCSLVLCLYLCTVLTKSTILSSDDQSSHDVNTLSKKLSDSPIEISTADSEKNDPISNSHLNADGEDNKEEGRTSSLVNSNLLMPTLCIGVLVRNKAHTLPYFLNGIENQQYPSKRITLIFYVDNTIDSSDVILNEWIQCNKHKYHNIILEVEEHNASRSSDEEISKLWTENHYQHIIKLRQKLLSKARDMWADFYLSIDADVILMNPATIEHLISVMLKPLDEDIIILAPLLNCTSSEHYSNFWGAMSEEGYYLRSEHYFDLQKRRIQGVYPVAMVHSMFLVNLKFQKSELIGYDPPPTNYTGPIDDIIIFSRSVQRAEIDFYLDNTQFYGYIPSPVDEQDLSIYSEDLNNAWLLREQDLFVHLRLQAIIDEENKQTVSPSNCLLDIANNQLPKLSKLGFDEIYFINLQRRTDRRVKMEYMFDQLGMSVKRYEAVDGKNLSLEKLDELHIKQLPGYTDPYHKRSLKYGEIGCFLSHYNIWNEMVSRGYQRVLILEDDLRFIPAFINNLNKVVREADENVPGWDLLYIGRKRMSKKEKRVQNTTSLVHPDYTYWTLGYILNINGAQKLLNQNPLQKMVAVDEYLPIMFDRHPRKDWLTQFEPRDILAISAEPLLVEPQRYTGEKYYISDTEDSEVVQTVI
ncbi:unnamed protein product [Trichobilharzia szidati]|nr:unnamed protein product [Trichobilharzia szidati]